jgi:hypothetical protein
LVDHVADTVALEEAVLAGSRLVLEIFYNESLQPLDFLVTRSSHFQ